MVQLLLESRLPALLPSRHLALLSSRHLLLNCRLQPLDRNRQPLVTVAHPESEFLQCNRQCLMSLALLRLCHLVLPLILFPWSFSSCCNRQPLVLPALPRLEHLGRLIASSGLVFLLAGPPLPFSS